MRVLNFADGFNSNEEPLLGTITANNFPVFASTAAFVAAKGEPAELGDIFQESSGKVRYFDGTLWKTVADNSDVSNIEALIQAANDLIADVNQDLIDITTAIQEDLADLETDLLNHVNATSNVHGIIGNVVGTSDVQDLSNKRFLNKTVLDAEIVGASESDGTAGADKTLPAPAKLVKVLTGNLTSIVGIGSVTGNQVLILVNRTGNTIPIKNNSLLALAGDRILNGTGLDLDFKNQASLLVVSDTSLNCWQIVGGAGGETPQVIQTMTASDIVNGQTTILRLDASLGSVNATLPGVVLGKNLRVKRIDSVEDNTVTLTRAGSDSIEGANTTNLIPFQSITLTGITANQWEIYN